MKKSILLLVLFIIAVSFYGCPYESAVAIGEPGIKINNNYTGTWTLKNTNTKYIVSKMDEYHLRIAAVPTDSLTKDTTIYNAHFSKVKDLSFLNIKKITNYNLTGSGTYYLYKFVLNSANEIAINELSSNIKEKFTSSGDLRKYIEKYLDLSFFYGNEEIYVRE